MQPPQGRQALKPSWVSNFLKKSKSLPLPLAGGWNQVIFKGLFQPEPLSDPLYLGILRLPLDRALKGAQLSSSSSPFLKENNNI